MLNISLLKKRTKMERQQGQVAGQQQIVVKVLKILHKKKLKKNFRTCPGTSERTAGGQQGDTNNNDNNIIYLNLLNKYEKRVQEATWFGEKIQAINEMQKEESYFDLTKTEQDELFKELM